MNNKAIQLAISTLIIIILGISVLIGLILLVTSGFDTFKSSTKPFLDTTQATSIKLACKQACDTQDKITFCEEEYEINEEKINCQDPRLEINCNLDCS